jgi:hypothetical protein
VLENYLERRENMARKSTPARTPEARENQLINLAMNLAEKKLRDGTASSQIITTLLNLGTAKAQLEKAKVESDLRVAEAKIEAMKSSEDVKELMSAALMAMKSYQGLSMEEEIDDEDY